MARRPIMLEACEGYCGQRLLERFAEVARGFLRARRDPVTPAAAALARDLRRPRRTRSGLRLKPWDQIADELVLAGHAKYSSADLQDAVSRLPAETHPLAPPSAAEHSALEQSWRAGWAAEFPAEPWPGLEEARRRIRTTRFPSSPASPEAA
jgi:hypothetical protein